MANSGLNFSHEKSKRQREYGTRAPRIAGFEFDGNVRNLFSSKRIATFAMECFGDYYSLYVEALAARTRDLDSEKVTLSDEENIARVIYWRDFHASMYNLHAWEWNQLLIQNLEGRLTPEEVKVIDDMTNGPAEWLEDVFKNVNGKHLTIECKGPGYKIGAFPIKSLPCGVVIPLRDVNKRNKKLVRYLWNRNFEDLPQEIRQNAGLIIPQLNQEVVAIANGYTIGNSDYIRAASRGVSDYYGWE